MSEKFFTSYALLGSGRVARHLSYYIHDLGLPLLQWSRNGDPEFNSLDIENPAQRLQQTLKKASHILMAVKDAAIPELVSFKSERHMTVHFSGALNLPNAAAAHPLMTFGPDLETPEWYRNIPFILDHDTYLEELLPGFPNVSFKLSPEKRTYYHALCSLAGNSTFLLWKSINQAFEKELDLPAEVLAPFLHQVVTNAIKSDRQAFTGPVARGDWSIVKDHLESLEIHPELKNAYRGYLELAQFKGISIPKGVL